MENNWLAKCTLSLDEDDDIRFNIEFKEDGNKKLTIALMDYLEQGVVQARDMILKEDCSD